MATAYLIIAILVHCILFGLIYFDKIKSAEYLSYIAGLGFCFAIPKKFLILAVLQIIIVIYNFFVLFCSQDFIESQK